MNFFNSAKDRVKWEALKRIATDAKTVFFAPTHSHYVGVDLFLECAAEPGIKRNLKNKFTELSQRVIEPDFRALCHRSENEPERFCAPDLIERDYGHDPELIRVLNRTLSKDHWRDLRKIHYFNFRKLYPEIKEEEWPV